tara:strand:- start:616 stop:1053 length:438 start_codon:yes stop_codon:yes gene_type:complete
MTDYKDLYLKYKKKYLHEKLYLGGADGAGVKNHIYMPNAAFHITEKDGVRDMALATDGDGRKRNVVSHLSNSETKGYTSDIIYIWTGGGYVYYETQNSVYYIKGERPLAVKCDCKERKVDAFKKVAPKTKLVENILRNFKDDSLF